MIEGQIVPPFFYVVTLKFAHLGVASQTRLLPWPCIFLHFSRQVMSRSIQAFNSGMTIAVLLHSLWALQRRTP